MINATPEKWVKAADAGGCEPVLSQHLVWSAIEIWGLLSIFLALSLTALALYYLQVIKGPA